MTGSKMLSNKINCKSLPRQIGTIFVVGYMCVICFLCVITNSENTLFTSAINNEVTYENKTFTSKYDSNTKNIIITAAAQSIGIDLKQIAERELGIRIIQDIFNSIKTQHSIINTDEGHTLKKLTTKIEKKIASVLDVFNETVKMIEEFGDHSSTKIHYDCSGVFTIGKSADCGVSRNSTLTNSSFSCPILNITEVFQLHRENIAAIKNEYFLPAGEDYRNCMLENMSQLCMSIYNDYCQPLNDPYFEHIYLKSIDHSPRQIILVMDHGSSLSQNQLLVAKALAKYIVMSMGQGDKICVVGISDSVDSNCDYGFSCESNRHLLLNFIDSLNKSKGLTNHSLGFETAFNLIDTEMLNSSADSFISILYVSKGLLSSITEAKTVLEIIANRQKDSENLKVIINTCALIDDWKTVIYEKHFLKDVAHQNYYKYNITYDVPLFPGVMEEISIGANSGIPKTLGPVVRRLMGSMHVDKLINRVNFFLPQLDETRTDPIVTISRVVQVKNFSVIGVATLQIFLEDIIEDIIYFNQYGNSYAFIVNTDGFVLMHPALRQVGYYLEQPWIADISVLEMVENINSVRSMILKKESGEIIVKRKSDKKLVEYTWQKLENAPYIVVIVLEVDQKPKSLSSEPSKHLTAPIDVCDGDCDLVYNRFDYLASGQYSLCRHIDDLTTLDAGSLFLSAACFQSPLKYLLSDKNASYFNIQNYMAYIKDKTKLLANPGLKSGIRSEIISLSTILPHWKRQFFNSRHNKYIVRRYIATKSGILVMYPGAHKHHRFDPVNSMWFVNAVKNPTRIILTVPYPDTGDAGYVVTISKAFVSASTSTTIVAALDVTFGYLHVLLMDVLPYCSFEKGDNEKIKCFIMDERGYLLSHPSLSGPSALDANGKPPIEGQHITYKESLVTNDILNHKDVVEKLVCSDLSSGTVQRYYLFNTSMNTVISNMISGDQCVQYQLIAVPLTNIFVGVVNTTCDDINTAFCPCSRIDRHCLNCGKMEQTACECPCECPDNIDCSAAKQNTNAIRPCDSVPFHLHQPVHHHSLITKVKPCSLNECHKYLTHRSCLGVVGCKWCQFKSDRTTRLASPFCTMQPLCFNGVLGANVPYGERILHGTVVKDGSNLHSKSSSTGAIPMGGALIALLFALILMCYFYHKRTQTQVTRHDHSCMRPVSLFALEKNNNNRIIEEPPTEPHNGLLQSAQEVSVALLTPVSPYLMNTGYCRPPTGDSDHGYSTMTPHEDTDNVEVDPLMPAQQQTLLSHHVLAPVTVHMVMDT